MWPTRRTDGSVDVAAQFVPQSRSAKAGLEAVVASYVERKAEQDSVDLLDDLAALPTVEDAEEGRLRVRFRSRPGATRWKDWLVEFTDTADQIPEVSFEGFFDEVEGSLRPHVST
jgi:hypothetical protein